MSTADGFEEFVAVVECDSITGAAEKLGLPRPTVSRRLAKLEERLSVRLLHRTTRQLTLTRQGKQLFERARLIVEAAREAEEEVRRLDDVPRGLLRLSIPPAVPEEVFSAWVTAYLRKYPEVRMEVVATSAHVDLVAEGFDLAIRRGEGEDQSLIRRILAVNRVIAVASPGYLETHGTPLMPEELCDHNCLVGFRSGTTPNRRWPLLDGGFIEVSGTLSTNQHDMRIAAARQGLGIALVVDRTAQPALDAGALIQVLPESIGRREVVGFVYPEREFVEPKVTAFIDLVLDWFERQQTQTISRA